MTTWIEDEDYEALLDTEEIPEDQLRPEDLEQAEYHAKIARRVAADLHAVEAHAQAQIAEIQAWHDRQTVRLNRQLNWRKDALRYFLAGSNKKTIDLVNATIRRRAGRSSIQVEDPDAFFQYVDREHLEDLVRVRREPEKKAIQDHLKKTGELPAGVTVVTGEESFSVSFPDDEKAPQAPKTGLQSPNAPQGVSE